MNLDNMCVYIDDPEELPAIIRWINKQQFGEMINDKLAEALNLKILNESFWIVFKNDDSDVLRPTITEVEPEVVILTILPEFRSEVCDVSIRKDTVEVLGKKYYADVLYRMLEMTPEADAQ